MGDPKIGSFRVGFGGDGTSGGTPRGPLRIVVLSGVAADDAYSTGAAPPGEPVAIDKVSFDSVMGALGPTLVIRVQDPFSPEAEPLAVELRWNELKAMRPDGIFAQVSALRALAEARKVVERAKSGGISAEAAREELSRILPRPAWASALSAEVVGRASAAPPRAPVASAASPAAPPGPRDAVDSLFDRVAVKGEPSDAEGVAGPAAPPPGLSAIVAAVARASRGPVRAGSVVGTALERLESAFGRILSDILRHPEVRRLEQAWRGLRLLVERSDARSGVEIDVVPVHKAGVAEALRALSKSTGRHAARAPIDLLVVDHEIGASDEDASSFRAWAETAEELHAPLLVNGHSSLLGASRVGELPKTLRRLAELQDPRVLSIRSAAGENACRWATVAMNGPLVRAAYSASSSRLREVAFSEGATDDAANVFAGPALAIAALCAQSFARTGWPGGIVGARDGLLADLPVREIDDGGAPLAIPLEAFVGDDTVRVAARAGVALLGCAPNHDAAILAQAPVFYRVGASATTALPDQLFAGRLAHAIEQLAAALPASVEPDAGARVAEAALADLFVGGKGPEIEARIRAGVLEVSVRPRRYAGTSLDEITLSAALGG